MKLERVNELPATSQSSVLLRIQAIPLKLRIIAGLEILSGNIIAAVALSFYSTAKDDSLWNIPHFIQFASALAALQILGGLGMLFAKTWAYKMVTFTAVLRMVSIPVGTLWGGWIVYVFNKELR